MIHDAQNKRPYINTFTMFKLLFILIKYWKIINIINIYKSWYDNGSGIVSFVISVSVQDIVGGNFD